MRREALRQLNGKTGAGGLLKGVFMDKSLPLHTTRATYVDIENRIIDEYLPRIGVYGFAVYLAILRYLNEPTNHCEASSATIARKLGMTQAAVLRHVKTLQRLQLLSPQLRFKDEGART